MDANGSGLAGLFGPHPETAGPDEPGAGSYTPAPPVDPAAPAPPATGLRGDVQDVRRYLAALRSHGISWSCALDNWDPPSVAAQAAGADPASLHQRLIGGPGTRLAVWAALIAGSPRNSRAAAAAVALILAAAAAVALILHHFL